MSVYEGVVAEVKGDKKAVVVLRPAHVGIVGAPHVGVFHPPTGGSQVAVEAVNEAKASVGDRVSVTGSPQRWWKNACKLIGVPLVGLIIGVVLVSLVMDADTSVVMKTVVILSGLLLGMVAGAVSYSRNPGSSDMVIGEVLEKGDG